MKKRKEPSINNLIMHLDNVSKSYKKNDKIINVLKEINVDFYSNNFYAIKGHSGSGKSTLINILGLVDKFDSGIYELYGITATSYNDKTISKLRMKNIGFIFQGINLDPDLSAYENVMIPMLINKDIKPKERKKRVLELLTMVGLEKRISHFPNELSGGEQQRVGIARALANNPTIILADEPTGNLDETAEREIFVLLKAMAEDGKCIVVVSHSDYVNEYADKVYTIKDGKLVGDSL